MAIYRGTVSRTSETRRARLGLASSALACALALAAAEPAHAQELTEQRRIEVARRLAESTVSVISGPSSGSGFVAGDERWIVTNSHVIRPARHYGVQVHFSSGTTMPAAVLLDSPEHDLAILQVRGEVPARPLALGDSSQVSVGQTVLAFGSPFGLDGTLTQGIVSALRDVPPGSALGGGRVRRLIQTDAPINPGNSGGALVDMGGRLIGINTAILSRSGGSNGIGFAIPSALVAQFVEQARAGHETFRRPWAGIDGQPVTADMAEGLGLDRPGGVVITQLHPQSAFLAAGLRPGDVITAVDGHAVNTPAEMIYRMSVAGIGARARITGIRQGRERTVDVALIAAPEEPPRDARVTGRGAAIPGMRLATVNPAVIGEYDLPLTARGVVVEDPGEVGLRAGLRAGDLLLAINGAAVDDTGEALELLRAARRRLSLEVQRGGRRVTMRFRL